MERRDCVLLMLAFCHAAWLCVCIMLVRWLGNIAEVHRRMVPCGRQCVFERAWLVAAILSHGQLAFIKFVRSYRMLVIQ